MCSTLAPLQVYNLVCFEQELHAKKTAPLSPLDKQVYGFDHKTVLYLPQGYIYLRPWGPIISGMPQPSGSIA